MCSSTPSEHAVVFLLPGLSNLKTFLTGFIVCAEQEVYASLRQLRPLFGFRDISARDEVDLAYPVIQRALDPPGRGSVHQEHLHSPWNTHLSSQLLGAVKWRNNGS